MNIHERNLTLLFRYFDQIIVDAKLLIDDEETQAIILSFMDAFRYTHHIAIVDDT